MATTRRATGDKGVARPSSEPRPPPGTGSASAPSRRSFPSEPNSDEVDTAGQRPRPPHVASAPSPAAAETGILSQQQGEAAEISEADISDADDADEPPKTDPEPVARALADVAVPESAPPSIPSAAAAATGTDGRGGVPVLPGHVIANRYEVLGVLGEGGMGIVYRCRDKPSGQLVAIKRVIPPPGNLANEYVMWFYKEARALAALDHPNIVRAHDFGQLRDGSPFLAMELVSGASLHDLTHARLGFPVLWSIVDQILDALAHAHARGVIHGDLKPSNVLVERRESEPPVVHVLDFGLAWL